MDRLHREAVDSSDNGRLVEALIEIRDLPVGMDGLDFTSRARFVATRALNETCPDQERIMTLLSEQANEAIHARNRARDAIAAARKQLALGYSARADDILNEVLRDE